MKPPWLSIVGIGEDGLDGLSPAARRSLRQARLIVGGARHLALVAPHEAQTLVWPSPIEGAYPEILSRRGEDVCVLASGDPFFYGVGSALTRLIDPAETTCFPSASAFALAASRLGWAQQDCALLTLHGRPLERIIPYLHRGGRVLALCWDETTPTKLARLLVARGLGKSRLTVCESLGGPRERVRSALAADFALDGIQALNTIALEVDGDGGARWIPRAPGLPDEWFESDGQITRREVRAVTLSALSPQRGELLWDIGAGSGSVGIEWMLADPANRAIAIEANEERAARIRRNAANLGTPDLVVAHGEAPDALQGLPSPDAIFIGGGATAPGVIDFAVHALRPGGRLVVNGVTLETGNELNRRYGLLGGSLLQLQLARAEGLGRFHGLRPEMQILQWSWRKPW